MANSSSPKMIARCRNLSMKHNEIKNDTPEDVEFCSPSIYFIVHIFFKVSTMLLIRFQSQRLDTYIKILLHFATETSSVIW